MKIKSNMSVQATIVGEKKGWHTLSDLGEKVTHFPNAMLIRVLLSEALPDPPTLIAGGREELW